MTTTSADVVLTDDEYLCIAFLADAPVPRDVPTVDLEEQSQVSAAIGRGLRTLGLRGWLTAEGGTSEEVAVAVLAATGRPLVMVAAVDDGLALAPGTELLRLIEATDGSGVLAMVTSTGVRRFTSVELTEGMDYLGALLTARAEVTDDLALCALVHATNGSIAGGVVVSDDSAVGLSGGNGDDMVRTPLGPDGDPRAELMRLLGRDDRWRS